MIRLPLLFVLLSAGDPVPDVGASVPTLVPDVTRAEIEAHVRFLAADERAGRVTGSAEAEICAQYLALVLERQGLAPAGDDGSFLQRVPLERRSWSAPPELVLALPDGSKRTFVFGRDFDGGRGYARVEALELRVARDLAHLPDRADPKIALFFDAPAADRRRAFEARGLAAGEGFGLFLVPGSSEASSERPVTPRSTLERRRAGAEAEPPRAVRVRGETLTALRGANGQRLSFDPHALVQEVISHNVVAVLRGEGTAGEPRLSDEAVVLTAHYDHIDGGHGLRPAGSDAIFNGADDDASGTAAVLEIAGALAHGPRLARTLVFALVTGEEFGLLGTDEYLDRPVVPLEHTVLNVNFEMIGRPDPKVGGVGSLWLTGFELTNLGAAFADRKLAIHPDPYPQEHFFERSDNIAFVRRGIVGQTLSSYNLHKDYHQPSDEVGRIDFAHMETATRTSLEAVRLVASGAVRPAWTKERPPARR